MPIENRGSYTKWESLTAQEHKEIADTFLLIFRDNLQEGESTVEALDGAWISTMRRKRVYLNWAYLQHELISDGWIVPNNYEPPGNEVKAAAGKSLLKLLRELKLFNKDTAYTLNNQPAILEEIYRKLSRCLPERWRTTWDPYPNRSKPWDTQRSNRLLSRLLGYEVCHVSSYDTNRLSPSHHFFYPVELTEPVYHCHYPADIISYQYHKAYVEHLRNNRQVRHCSFHNKWFMYDNFINIINPDKTTTEIAFTPESVRVIEACSTCERWEWKKRVKYVPALEVSCCGLCASKFDSMKNDFLNRDRPVTDYHSHRQWRYYIQRTKSKKDIGTLPMGLEIEVRALEACRFKPTQDMVDGNERTPNLESFADKAALKIYDAAEEAFPNSNNIYFEEDGSLDSGGFEIISNPMTLYYHHRYWHALLPEMREHARGWQVSLQKSHNTQYGIHITVNRKYFTDSIIARLAKFCGFHENRAFIWGIAQRSQLYGGHGGYTGTGIDTSIWTGKNKNTPLNSYFKLKDKKILTGPRYNIYPKAGGKLVEIRMFRSTLNTTSFFKNLEFIDAFYEWSKSTKWSIEAPEFIKWLTKKEEYHNRYANLLAYLAQPHWAIKYQGNIISTSFSSWKT